MEVEQPEPADLLAAIAAEKFDQPMGGRDIGADGVSRSPPVMRKIAAPAYGQRPRGMRIVD
jgi:hypothetical protein